MRLDTANRSVLALVGVSLIAGVWILCGAATCVLLGLVGYRVGEDGPHMLVGADPLWPALVFLVLTGGGAMRGLVSLRRQAESSRRLAAHVRATELPMTAAVEGAARATGLTGRVVLVDAEEPFSFTYGAFAPRVAVSRGLVECASEDELAAVLEHEGYHVHNLDPLKVVAARSLRDTFFYLPVLQELLERYLAGRELAADRTAVETWGRRSLAGALFKVVRGPRWQELSAAAAIGGPELLDVRVAQLERGAEPRIGGVSRRGVLLSALGTAAVVGSLGVAIVAAGGPSIVAQDTGMGPRPLDVLLAFACTAPIVGLGWAVYRRLSRRARRPLRAPES